MNVLKKVMVFTALAASLFIGGSALPAYAASPFDASKQAACQGVELKDSGNCSSVAAKGNRMTALIRTVINILSFIAGAAAVIMIIYAGLKYITSGGEASNISSAKSALLYAVIGLIVVMVSQLLVKYVIANVK